MHYADPASFESTTTPVQRETGTIFLRTRRRFAGGALLRPCAPPWHRWSRGALARAERTADGHVHLVVLRARRGGVRMSLTGIRAAHAESLAPVAARIRRALAVHDGGPLRGTSPFEDAVTSLLDELGASVRIRRAVGRLGARCPAAPAIRAMPDSRTVLDRSGAELARALGSPILARRLQALARAFETMAPCPPIRS